MAFQVNGKAGKPGVAYRILGELVNFRAKLWRDNCVLVTLLGLSRGMGAGVGIRVGQHRRIDADE